MLSKGEKVFVVTRRLFDKDLRRHFVGEIQDVSGAAMRVQGYAFIFDETMNDFIRREDLRTRIFSIIDAGILIAVIPADVSIEEIRYRVDEKNRRILTDGKNYKMNVSEFGITR